MPDLIVPKHKPVKVSSGRTNVLPPRSGIDKPSVKGGNVTRKK